MADDFEEIFDVDSDRQRSNLIMQMRGCSGFLKTQKDDLLPIWEEFMPRVVSFYAKMQATSRRNVNNGSHLMTSWKCYLLRVVYIRQVSKR